MSERGRGSEPMDEHTDTDTDGEDAAERAARDYPVPPTAARPIAPYDPYRSSADATRQPRRNVAAEAFEPPGRRSSRGADNDPFLPDDDPLNAEAWQLELDELAAAGGEVDAALPEFGLDRDAPPRRPRRQPPAPRGRRESGAASARPPRRTRAAASARGVPRPTVALGVPRVVAGSSLITDQTVLALLGINAASIVVMALLLGVRLGGIASPMALQLNAAGSPALWGPPSVLWRLPLMSFFLTVMFLVVAWFVHPIDRFAARFALAAAVVAQAIAWVAVIQHLA